MLKVRVENLGQIVILHATGQIVIGPEIEVLRRLVQPLIDISTVVLDLSRVSRIDAYGLGVLIELREHLRARNIKSGSGMLPVWFNRYSG